MQIQVCLPSWPPVGVGTEVLTGSHKERGLCSGQLFNLIVELKGNIYFCLASTRVLEKARGGVGVWYSRQDTLGCLRPMLEPDFC